MSDQPSPTSLRVKLRRVERLRLGRRVTRLRARLRRTGEIAGDTPTATGGR